MSAKRTNQHKPCPPEDQILPTIRKYWLWGWNDKAILKEVHDTIDSDTYGLSLTSLKHIRKKHAMLSARQQSHTFETIAGPVAEIRRRLPAIGVEDLIHTLRTDYDGMRVPRSVLMAYLKLVEPEAVRARRVGRLHRRRFWATGVNDVWSFDQHDKWKRFGIMLHLCVEIYSGKILWLRAWWSNRQPPLIARYYFDTVREHGFTCLITQSDAGREANAVANAHTILRQKKDPSLAEARTIQHRWCSKGKNIKPEIKWSVLRRQFSPSFEAEMERGIEEEIFIQDDQLHLLVFRWIAIPWIQAELDNYRLRTNTKRPRADRKKFLPHGVPDHIFEQAHKYEAEDYKIDIENDLLDEVEAIYAPPSHPVFQLVPTWLTPYLDAAYDSVGRPEVSISTLWEVFVSVRDAVQEKLPEDVWAKVYDLEMDIDKEVIPELDLLANGEPEGFGVDDSEGDEFEEDEGVIYAVFSDEEEPDN